MAARPRRVLLGDLRISLKANPAWRRQLAPGDRRLWLFWSVGLRIEQHSNPLWAFEIFWKRLLAVAGAGAFAGYLGAVTAVFLWLDRVPQNRVGWGDVFAVPWDYAGFTRKRGQSAIDAGLAHLKAQNYADAFYNLRIGLARAPDNVEGRLALARLYAGSNPAQALKLLEDGLAHGAGDLKLLAALFAVLNQQQAHARSLALADELLAGRHGKLPPEAIRTVSFARAGALLAAGRPAETLEALRALPAETAGSSWTSRRHQLEVDALLRLARWDEAAVLYRVARADGRIAADDLRLEAELAIAQADAGQLQSVLRRLKAAAPDAPGTYIYAFQCWHRLKRLTFREATLEEFYRLFARNDAAMQLLAAAMVNLDLPEEVQRTQRIARQSRLSDFAYRVHLTEIALRRGDFAQATRQLRDWEGAVDTLPPPQRHYPELIKRLVRAAFTREAGEAEALLAHLRGGPVQLPVLLLTINTLETAGATGVAREVLRVAESHFPGSDPVMRWQATFAARPVVAETNAPSLPANEPVVGIPPRAAEALALLDRQLAADDIAQARDLLRAIRARPPAWLAAHEAEFAVRELRLSLAALDMLATRSLVRGYLQKFRTGEDARRLLPLIAQLLASQRQVEAKVIHDEIIATHGTDATLAAELAVLQVPDDLAAVTATRAEALASLDRWAANEQWAQVERMLDQLEQRPPDWAPAAQTELKLRAVQLHLALGRRPQAFATLKEVAVKSGAPRSAAFKLARDLHSSGRGEHAVLVAREIVRLLPGDAAAERLLREVQAPVPAGDAP